MHRFNMTSKLKITIKFLNFIFLLYILLGYISFLSAFTDILMYKKDDINSENVISTVEFDVKSIKNNKTGDNVEINNPSYDEYIQLAHNPDVKSYELNFIDSLLSSSLKDIDKDDRVGLFNVKGVDKEFFYDLSYENIYLIAGRSFSVEELENADNKLIISNVVAENNNIEVGDTIDLQICNPSNARQHITRKYTIIGIFSPKISNEKQNDDTEVTETIKQFIEHSHSQNEEDKNTSEDIEYYRSDSDRMKSLKRFLLIEDLNTVYMSNTTAISLNMEIGTTYGKEYLCNDYQATYILQSKSTTEDFKFFANKILPKNFTIKSEKDAFELWMPNTAKAEKLLGIYCILLGMVLVIYSALAVSVYVINNKDSIIQYRIMGIERRKINKNFKFRFYILMVISSSIFIPLGNLIAAKRILPRFLYNRVDANYYYNIQKMTRDIGTCFIPQFHYLPNAAFIIILCITLLLIYFVARKMVKVSLNHVIGGKKNV